MALFRRRRPGQITRRLTPTVAALAIVLAAGAISQKTPAAETHAAVCLVPGAGRLLDQIWHPDMRGAIAYARTRRGDISFAVRTDRRFYGYRPDHTVMSASVVKAMLMVAYLDQPSVRNRNLDGHDRSLLIPMITRSDNTAASEVRNIVGNGSLVALAHRVRMTHFATNPIWGLTQITARDQTKFFLHLETYVARLHRGFALGLLASIIPAQRWGVGEVAPKGWKLYFKGGWGYGTGLVDHQVALFVRGCARVSIAVLTLDDGSHAYGKATLRGIFARLLRGIPT